MQLLSYKITSIFNKLTRFLLIYCLLFGVYSIYLTKLPNRTVDVFSYYTSILSQGYLALLGIQTELIHHPLTASVLLVENQIPFVEIIEGCNAVSILILFTSIYFSLFPLTTRQIIKWGYGVLILIAINILRIGLVFLVTQHVPRFSHITHDVVFPLIIYGTLFGLLIVYFLLSQSRFKIDLNLRYLIFGIIILLVNRYLEPHFGTALDNYFDIEFNPNKSLPLISNLEIVTFYSIRFAIQLLILLLFVKGINTMSNIDIWQLSCLLTLLFFVLIGVFIVLYNYHFPTGYILPFYIRKIILQPILLMVIIPFMLSVYSSHNNLDLVPNKT